MYQNQKMRCSSERNLWERNSLRGEDMDISANASEISESEIMPTCPRQGVIPRMKAMWSRQYAMVRWGLIVLLIAVMLGAYMYYDGSLFEAEAITTRARKRMRRKVECPTKPAGVKQGSNWGIGFN